MDHSVKDFKELASTHLRRNTGSGPTDSYLPSLRRGTWISEEGAVS